MKAANRRRKFFIDKKLQGMYALVNLLIAAVIALLIGLEIARTFLTEFGWPLGGKSFNMPDLIYLIKLVLLAVIGGVFFWLLSAFAGHRIAGPVYRLDKSLSEVTKGNYSLRIQFRKKDFFRHIAETFNEMNESLEQKFRDVEDKLAVVKEIVKTMPHDMPQTAELRKLLDIK